MENRYYKAGASGLFQYFIIRLVKERREASRKHVFQPRIEPGTTKIGSRYIKLKTSIFGGIISFWGRGEVNLGGVWLWVAYDFLNGIHCKVPTCTLRKIRQLLSVKKKVKQSLHTPGPPYGSRRSKFSGLSVDDNTVKVHRTLSELGQRRCTALDMHT
jgi:hypothetical protein